MAKSKEKSDTRLLAAFDRGLAESARRNTGEFDGLMGDPAGPHSELLTAICRHLRNYLLDRCSQEDVRGLVRLKRPPGWDDSPEKLARELMRQYEPREGFHWVTPVPEDVELVLGLVNMIASALLVEPERRDEIILGKGGKRDKARQAGTRKPRRKRFSLLDEWLDKADLSLPNKKLWRKLEGDFTADNELYCDGDEIIEVTSVGESRTASHSMRRPAFDKRVAIARKRKKRR